ncbi:MAG: hypothetical protein R3F39_04680 [Myxococcota bacterium]
MRSLTALAVFAASTSLALSAVAAPGLMPVQGLLTTVDGTPVDGLTDLQFGLYTSETGGTPFWTEAQSLDLDAGFFTAYLGDISALDMALFADTPTTWLGVAIEGATELPRVIVGEAGRAGYAQLCGDSTTLGGLSPEDLAIAAGPGLLLSGGVMSLSAAGCQPGDVLKRSPTGDAWVCGPDQVGTGDGAPSIGAGLVLFGQTLSVDQAAVEGWARGVCYDSVSELTEALDSIYMDAGYAPAWGDLTDVPAGFADGVDDGTAYLGGEGVEVDGDTIGLKPAALGALGGVAAFTCSLGDVVVGIGQDGTVQCGPDLQGGGSALPPLAATEPTKLSTGSTTPGKTLATDADFVYFATKTDIARVALAGGIPQGLSSGHSDLVGIAVDATYVYYADYAETSSTGLIGRIPKAGGSKETISPAVPSAKRPNGLLLLAGTLYWGSESAVNAVSISGGSSIAFDTGKAELLTHDATHLWFVRSTVLTRVPIAGGAAQAVARVGNATAIAPAAAGVVVATTNYVAYVPKAGGRTRLLIAAGNPVSALITHNGWAYAVAQGGVLLAMAADGSGQPDIVSLSGAVGLAIRGETLIFSGANADGTGIMSFPALAALPSP